MKPGYCPESFNLERPEVIEEIAGLYLEAGADIVHTNTFGGSPLKLSLYGLDDKTEEINAAAVHAARKAVGERAVISAAIGPSGKLLKPFGDVDSEEMYSNFERQIGAVADAGADMITVETMTDLTEATLAVSAAKKLSPDTPVLATMTFDSTPRGFRTIMGASVKESASALQQAGADIIGSNCGHGIELMIEIAGEFRSYSNLPIAIQSNAGLPEMKSGKPVYPETPEFMAGKAEELIAAGVSVIGGCCGTTPEHIRAIKELVSRL